MSTRNRCTWVGTLATIAAVATAAVATTPAPAAAQALAPHLTGDVGVDPAQGLLHGSLCLSGFDARTPVRFLLAAPLNVKAVTDTAGNELQWGEVSEPRTVGEAREYLAQAPSKEPLTSMCVQFRGAVPVYETNSARSDWKGRIAATHGTLRAAEQTRWYPTLFDSAAATAVTDVTYRLHVACATCRALYVNGAPVVVDTSGSFASTVPRAPLLFVGDFDVRKTPALTFLGGSADSATAHVFTDAFDRISGYYAKLLGIPYGDHPVLLSFYSVSQRYPPGQVSWQFVTWPTITFSGGIDFGRLVENADGGRLPDWLWKSLSHEMGHYYFGTLHMPHGPLFWPVLESTAEYLSLKSAAHFRGDLSLYASVARDLAAIDTSLTPLNRVSAQGEVTSAYRYQVAPLYLLELDHAVGEAKVAAMLRALARSPDAETADWDQLVRAARTAGITEAQLTAAMAPDAVRRDLSARVERTLATAADTADPDVVVNAIASLIGTDTTSAGRLRLVPLLQKVVARDPGAMGAYYQIGKIGALTGKELDAATRALERYLSEPAQPGQPSHGAAEWRLGMIAEARGDLTRAKEMYARAVEHDPSLGDAAAALDRLRSAK